jgi:uncharacterized protein (TIGR03118 family)
MKRFQAVLMLIVLLFPAGLVAPAKAAGSGPNSYKVKPLVADQQSAGAATTDANLINPWGVAFFSGAPFWIANNNSGTSTLYDQNGVPQPAGMPLIVTIPPPTGQSGTAAPTGIVANQTNDFQVNGAAANFIFATEDGTVSAWNGGTAATLVVNNMNTSTGPVYKGLAPVTNAGGNFLLASNFRTGQIDVFDKQFQKTNLTGSFTEPDVPAGFAPFGIHVINNQVYVTYAMQDGPKHDPVAGAGNGFVAIFDVNGNFKQTLIKKGPLNSPWGVTIAPASFGALGGDLLVGNFDDGTINAFDPNTGATLAQMMGTNGQPVVEQSLWELIFGDGQTGDKNTLYITAGGAMEKHGLFAAITVGQAAAADFALAANPASPTVMRGNSVSTMITVTPQNGFNGSVTFSASGLPSNSTASFNPASVMVNGSAMTTTLTIGTKASIPGTDLRKPDTMALPQGLTIATLGLLLLILAESESIRRLLGGRNLVRGGLAIVLLGLAVVSGCGGSMKSGATPTGAANVMVTATSGSTSHTIQVNLMVQ